MKVAWISNFPIEWLPDKPAGLPELPRQHALSWQRVLLLDLLANHPEIELHVCILRPQIKQALDCQWKNAWFHLRPVPGGIRAPTFFWPDTFCLRPLLKRIQPDVVHAWGAEKGAGLVARRLGFPYLVTVQGLLTWYEEVASVNRYDRLMARFERYLLRRCEWVTTEANFSVDYLRRRFPKPTVRRIEHAPDWAFHQLARTPQTNPRRLLYVGTLDYRKGFDVLLRAWDALAREIPFEATVIGQPVEPFFSQVRASVSPQLWGRIQWKPSLSPAEVAAEMARATLLVFPTRADTSPNVVKESAVAGLPVAASAVGGIPDYIVEGENGVLFAPDNLEACLSGIRRALEHPLFGQGLVAAPRLQAARDYLSPKLMGDSFAQLYGEVLARSQGR